MTADDATAPAVRYQVVAGGEVTPEELAAVTVALTPIAVGPAETGPADVPGWLRAALHEGVGGPPLSSADQVAGLR